MVTIDDKALTQEAITEVSKRFKSEKQDDKQFNSIFKMLVFMYKLGAYNTINKINSHD